MSLLRLLRLLGPLALWLGAGCNDSSAQQGPFKAPRPQAGALTWPQFRGPGGLGASDETGLPVRWSDDEGIIWKTELPGPGTSSPVIVGDRVFLTCHTGYGLGEDNPGRMEDLKRFVLCLDRRDGRILWRKEVETQLPESAYTKRMFWHGYASSTPVADAERVYVFFGKSGVAAFDHDGNRLWQADVGSKTHEWGSAASPVLHGDLVIVNAYAECGKLVALNKTTGEEVWRAGELSESWNTPLLVSLPGGKTELVVGNMGYITGFDPATGQELWRCEGPNWYVVGSLVAHDGVVFCIVGQNYEAIAIRAGGRGNVSNTHVVWRGGEGSNVSSPVYYNGHLYFAHESSAIAYCLDAKTGDVVYEQRLRGRLDAFYASPVVADGKLYYVSRQGGTVVLEAGPEFKPLSLNRIESDRSVFNASPAVVGGRLFLRSNRFLYCLGE